MSVSLYDLGKEPVFDSHVVIHAADCNDYDLYSQLTPAEQSKVWQVTVRRFLHDCLIDRVSPDDEQFARYDAFLTKYRKFGRESGVEFDDLVLAFILCDDTKSLDALSQRIDVQSV